jgi:hypothetical protein
MHHETRLDFLEQRIHLRLQDPPHGVGQFDDLADAQPQLMLRLQVLLNLAYGEP